MTPAHHQRLPLSRRIRRELLTLRIMIGMYCRAYHQTDSEPCEACGAVWDYARRRVEDCPFRADKPSCVNCTVHCFKADVRERMREIMRYAGPRMMLRHPCLALLHVVDGWRSTTAR